MMTVLLRTLRRPSTYEKDRERFCFQIAPPCRLQPIKTYRMAGGCPVATFPLPSSELPLKGREVCGPVVNSGLPEFD